MNQEELRQLICDELQDIGCVLETHEDGINWLIAEKDDDRNVMRVIQRSVEAIHERVAKLEQCVDRLHRRVTRLEQPPQIGR